MHIDDYGVKRSSFGSGAQYTVQPTVRKPKILCYSGTKIPFDAQIILMLYRLIPESVKFSLKKNHPAENRLDSQ